MTMRGKYKDVLEKYGKAGFGLPELAPKEGAFPLYPIRRARYALAIVASDVYDVHPDERRRVIAAALHAHPSLATEARHVRATVRERHNPRVRTNMKAPYWFVSEGSGFRLLERGEPTSTTYRSIAAAKADVSERNSAFRAKRKKNPSAWQKELRKSSRPTRSKFEVVSVKEIREGTYRLELDLGRDGAFPVTVYPDGYMQSGVADLKPALREKIEKWLKKNVKPTRRNPIGADWKEVAERLLARRTGKTMDDFHYRAYLRAVIADNSSQASHLVNTPFIGALEARDDLIDEYGKGPVRRNGRKR
jgi:hypothetical protein